MVVAVLLLVLLALLRSVVLFRWRGRRRWRWRRANDLAADLHYGRSEVTSVPLWDEVAIDRLRQLVAQPVRLAERPAFVSGLEKAGNFVAATGELACDGPLDRGRGSRMALCSITAAPGEEQRATRREPSVPPENRAAPFPRSPPASARQGRRPAETGPVWHRGRARRTSCRDCRPVADQPSPG